MYHVNETDISDINSPSAYIDFQMIISILKVLHLFRLWDYHTSSADVSFYTHESVYMGGDDIVENDSVNLSRAIAVMLNNFLNLWSRKVIMDHFF